MLFREEKVMTIILIDLDVEYQYMQRYGLFELLKRKIELAEQIFNVHFVSVVFRKSQSKHVHIFLKTKEELSNDQIVQIKFFLNEDHKRLNFEIGRIEKLGRLDSFFWMTKTKKKKRNRKA